MADRSMRFVGFGEEVREQVAAMLRAGKSAGEIGRMPGMPSHDTIRNWRREQPERFGRPILSGSNHAAYPQKVWDAVVELLHDGVPARTIGAMPGMPHWTVIGKRCRRDPDLRQFVGRHRRVAQGRLAAAIEALREGKTLNEVTDRQRIISRRTIERYRRRSRALDRLIGSLLEANAAARKSARQGARRRKAVDPDVAMRSVEKAVSRTMPADVRQEIIAMMLVDLVEGSLLLEEVPQRVAEYRTRFYRQFSKFGPQSLDAPAYRDGGRATVGDTIDASTFHF